MQCILFESNFVTNIRIPKNHYSPSPNLRINLLNKHDKKHGKWLSAVFLVKITGVECIKSIYDFSEL